MVEQIVREINIQAWAGINYALKNVYHYISQILLAEPLVGIHKWRHTIWPKINPLPPVKLKWFLRHFHTEFQKSKYLPPPYLHVTIYEWSLWQILFPGKLSYTRTRLSKYENLIWRLSWMTSQKQGGRMSSWAIVWYCLWGKRVKLMWRHLWLAP